MKTEAPDFNPGYPSRGERIGPAWKAIWKMLDTRKWVTGPDLARTLAGQFDLRPVTIRNLLREASSAGLLDRKLINATREGGRGGYRVTQYRVALDKSDVQ